jgi:Lar family restriction alleviation protein
MTDELKPCPLCGGEAVYESTQHKHGIVHSVYCEECGIEIARLNKQGAIEAWNRRII